MSRTLQVTVPWREFYASASVYLPAIEAADDYVTVEDVVLAQGRMEFDPLDLSLSPRETADLYSALVDEARFLVQA